MHYARLTRHGTLEPTQASGVSVDYEGPVTCRVCGDTKPHTQFYRRSRGDRRRTECKDCAKRKAKASADDVEFGDERWLRRRSATLMRKYGITHEEFLVMRDRQEGKCAICKDVPVAPDGHITGLHVDHCHETGRVRSLLCARCNTTVGHIEDIGVKAVSDYLFAHAG